MEGRRSIRVCRGIFLSGCGFLLGALGLQAVAISEEAFMDPPNEYRITQYQLTPQTLQRYPDYGIGGVMAFFYSILYPESERQNFRLGKEGPGIIGDLVDAARQIDYNVWLADDWGYPSGMAGGRVVAENPDFEVKSLVMLAVSGSGSRPVEFTLPENLHDIVHARIYPFNDGLIDLSSGREVAFTERLVRTEAIDGDWELRVFARFLRNKDTQAQSTIQQFGHTGRYPDLMNREAMSRFIANMHEPILARIDDPASKVKGFYCNEPNLMQTHWDRTSFAPYACAPWSDALPDLFRTVHGYEVFSVLPYLFEGDGTAARRARIHYRQAVAELLTDSFARQIREWCNARGIQSSGHFLLNEYLSMHVQGYGDLMRFVSEFDVPALDIPIPNPDEFKEFDYQQSRFFSSVTSWKQRDMTLMLLDPIIGGYGRSRLSPDLPLLLNSINMAAFHGVDFFTSYLPLEPKGGTIVNGHEEKAAGYSKEEYQFLNLYTGRLTQVLRGARRDAGVGLYYPVSMFQSDLLASDKPWPVICRLHTDRQDAWERTERSLLAGDIEYMIVHPRGIAEAELVNGYLKIGYGSYHTIVMPRIDFVPLDVAERLAEFMDDGGTVIWVDSGPLGAEHAVNDAAVKSALGNVSVIPGEALVNSISRAFSSDFNLAFTPGTDRLTVGRFRNEEQQIYLLVNREQEDISVCVKAPHGTGSRVTVLDPSTGTIRTQGLPMELMMNANRALLLISESQEPGPDAQLKHPCE